MPNKPEKRYQLEMRFAIVETDERGYQSSPYNRFELVDTVQLGNLTVPRIAEVMANLHSAFSNIADITNKS